MSQGLRSGTIAGLAVEGRPSAMAGTTHRLWLLSLSIFAAVEPIRSSSGYHYHRYMLSDYRPQHTHELQKDYKPLPRPKYSESTELEYGDQPGEPQIKLAGQKKRVMLSSLLMRIYNGKKFLCMGVLISPSTVTTVSFCVNDLQKDDITIKTFSDDELSLVSDPFRSTGSLLSVLSLEKQVDPYKGDPQLCDLTLQQGKNVQLPEYRRKTNSVVNRISEIMPAENCLEVFNDSSTDVSPMLCVANDKPTTGCEMTYGNPLIYNGQICGINWSGHNCNFRGVDVFVPVENILSITRRIIASIDQHKLEDILV